MIEHKKDCKGVYIIKVYTSFFYLCDEIKKKNMFISDNQLINGACEKMVKK